VPLPSAALPPHHVPAVLPFGFNDFFRQTGGNKLFLFWAIQEIDKLFPQGPTIVHSNRSGGDVTLLKIAFCAYFEYFDQSNTIHRRDVLYLIILIPNFCIAGIQSKRNCFQFFSNYGPAYCIGHASRGAVEGEQGFPM
jgi:hypothetical protein